MADLWPGDVVAQADGPPMTVDRVDGDRVHCIWFVGGELMSDSFPAESLKVTPCRQ